MRHVDLSGDEQFYASSATAIARTLLGDEPSSNFSSLAGVLIGNGWFMPGTSVLLSPIAVLMGGEPTASALRGYIVSVNILLLFAIYRFMRARSGVTCALAAISILLFCPGYVLFLSTLWSDLPSVHFALVTCLWLDRRMLEKKTERPAISGLLIALATYARGLYPPLIAVASFAWLLPTIKRRALRTEAPVWLLKTAVMTLVFALLLLPWSSAVSKRFGVTLTATTMALSQLAMFGTADYVPTAIAATGIDNSFFAMQRFIEQKAEREGRTYMAQAKKDRDSVVRALPVSVRLHVLSENVRRYFLDPNMFTDRFIGLRCKSGACAPDWLASGIRSANILVWTVIAIFGALLFAIPAAERNNSYFAPIFWKALVGLICLHPLLLYGHGRYYVQLVPLFAVAVALVACRQWPFYRLPKTLTLHEVVLGASQAAPAFMTILLLVLIVHW